MSPAANVDGAARCKIDGCTENAMSRFGPYGGLCETHRGARLAERRAAQNGKGEMRAATPPRAAETSGTLDYEAIVTDALVQIDDLILAAEKRVGQLLRAELAARIVPRSGEGRG